MLKKKYIAIFIILISLVSIFGIKQVVLGYCSCTCQDGTTPKHTPSTSNPEGHALNPTDCKDNLCNSIGITGSTAQYCPTLQNYPPSNNTNNSSNSNGNNERITIKNPLNPDGGSLLPQDLYGRLISALLAFVGVGALVAFVYAGFMFLISSGNQERVKKAKDTMLYAVIGIFVAMASYAILSFIFTTLENATGQ